MEINVKEQQKYEDELEEYYALRDKAEQKLAELGQDIVLKKFKEFFIKHPEVVKIGFTAYTPHFMDGDPCIYSVNQYYYCIPELDDNPAESHYDWHEGTFGFSVWDPETKTYVAQPGFEELKESMHELEAATCDPDLAMKIYGDHAYIEVTPEEITVTEWYHD